MRWHRRKTTAKHVFDRNTFTILYVAFVVTLMLALMIYQVATR